MTDAEDGHVIAVVCGEINGKNGFGAYAGFHPFFVELNMKSKGSSRKASIIRLGSISSVRVTLRHRQPTPSDASKLHE